MLFLWSATALLLEVPSGAWADTVSRRGLLVLGSALTASGFAAWTVLPSYAGFAIGFVLWGVGGALQSGTFQALLYDELASRGTARAYPRILGFATSAAEAGALLGILAAAPLYAVGGYELVGWVSVCVVLLQAVVAASLPRAPRAVSVAAVDELEEDEAPPRSPTPEPTGLTTYVAMLRSGTGEAMRHPRVRGGVLLASLLYGYTAFDEYFALLAGEQGVATGTVPLLIALTVTGSLLGSVLAGRTAAMRSSTMAWSLVVAGATLAAGALLDGSGAAHLAGFALIGLAYGIITNATVVSEARLQDAIEGSARATVTSAAGLLSELVALVIYAVFAALSLWWSTPVIMALLALPVMATALVVGRWLPARRHSD